MELDVLCLVLHEIFHVRFRCTASGAEITTSEGRSRPRERYGDAQADLGSQRNQTAALYVCSVFGEVTDNSDASARRHNHERALTSAPHDRVLGERLGSGLTSMA